MLLLQRFRLSHQLFATPRRPGAPGRFFAQTCHNQRIHGITSGVPNSGHFFDFDDARFSSVVLFILKDKLDNTAVCSGTARVATSTKRVHQSAVPHRTTGPLAKPSSTICYSFPLRPCPSAGGPLDCAPSYFVSSLLVFLYLVV